MKRPARSSMRIKCPPFGVVAIITWGERGWASYRRQVQDAGFPDPGVACIESSSGECIGSCIWMNGKYPSTLVHELHHLVTNLCDHLRVEDEETEAYMQTWLFRKVVERWGK